MPLSVITVSGDLSKVFNPKRRMRKRKKKQSECELLLLLLRCVFHIRKSSITQSQCKIHSAIKNTQKHGNVCADLLEIRTVTDSQKITD